MVPAYSMDMVGDHESFLNKNGLLLDGHCRAYHLDYNKLSKTLLGKMLLAYNTTMMQLSAFSYNLTDILEATKLQSHHAVIDNIISEVRSKLWSFYDSAWYNLNDVKHLIDQNQPDLFSVARIGRIADLESRIQSDDEYDEYKNKVGLLSDIISQYHFRMKMTRSGTKFWDYSTKNFDIS